MFYYQHISSVRMRSFLFLYLLSHSLFSTTAQQCSYFDPHVHSNTCDATITTPVYMNNSEFRAQLNNLRTYISALRSVTSFQMLHKDNLIASVGTPSSFNQTVTLSQPFLLALSSLILSDSSHSSYTPFPKILRRLAPGINIENVPKDSYLSDILSLQVYDPSDDQIWYGPSMSVDLSRKAYPAVERILEAYLGETMRHLVQKIRVKFGLENFRLDQTSGGSKVIRSTTKDLLRMGRIISNLMSDQYSNFSQQYSHFPLRSQELMRSFKEFKYGWWVNGATFQGDKSNLIQLAPGDMISSLECTTNIYIAPSWDIVLVIGRGTKHCGGEVDWLEEDRRIWELISEISLGNEIMSRYSLGFVITGVRVLNNFLFFFLYCCIGHVVTTYIVKLMWNLSCMMSDKTKYK